MDCTGISCVCCYKQLCLTAHYPLHTRPVLSSGSALARSVVLLLGPPSQTPVGRLLAVDSGAQVQRDGAASMQAPTGTGLACIFSAKEAAGLHNLLSAVACIAYEGTCFRLTHYYSSYK